MAEKLVHDDTKAVELRRIPVVFNKESAFGITVTTLTGKRVRVYVESTTTVEELKLLI